MSNIRRRGDKFQVSIRITGAKPVYASFDTMKEARAWQRTSTQRIAESDPVNPRISIDTLIDRYVDEVAPKRKMAPTHVTHDIQSVRNSFGGMTMADLQGRGLIEWARRHEGSGATRQWRIARLRGLLRQAELHWDVKVPWADIAAAQKRLTDGGVLTAPRERDRRCSDEELAVIKALAPKGGKLNWHDVFDFCVASAMRISEVARITWSDLDRPSRTVVIRDRKHPTKKYGNHQVVPLLGGAFEIAERQRVWPQDGRIFPLATQYASKVFHNAAVAGGVDEIVLHDLRHEGISRLFEVGFKIEEVAMVSGHADWTALKRYTHLSPASLVGKEAELRARL